ncbi:MAG: IS1096 element passenger TnpR family protein [Flavobacteriales bacterium]
MKYSITIYLESKEDIIRKVEIDSQNSLLELHKLIVDSFKLHKNELASFYSTNHDLELLEEIPLIAFEENNKSSNMENTTIENILDIKSNRLIYIYDYMLMWRFLVELTDNKGKIQKSVCIKSVGEIPKEAPEIIFDQSDKEESYEDSIDEDDSEYDELY